MWPARMLANSRTVSEINRMKVEMTSSGPISSSIGPCTPAGMRLLM